MGPVAELDVDVVFAFAKPWLAIAKTLALTPEHEWGPEHLVAKGCRAATFRLPNARQRLIVVWQGGYAGPPAGEDADRLRALVTVWG